MNNYLYMTDEFERQKKVKAYSITFGIAGSLLLLFILIKWPLPDLPQPLLEEVIEVNLGSGDVGSGTDQPMLPGQPAPEEQTAYNPPRQVRAAVNNAKDIETDERNTDAPAITRPTVSNPKATEINNENKTVKTDPAPQPVPTPAPPKPKATMSGVRGGTGNGGNGATTYERGGSEGIAGGTGDQGRPGGDPNGRVYTGTPRNLGVKVVSIPSQSFEDDFNQNGKVAVDVTVDDNGRLLSANYQPRGTTVSDRKMINIALRRAREISYPKYDGGFKQTLVFNFTIKN
jgi:hypothetical protein